MMPDDSDLTARLRTLRTEAPSCCGLDDRGLESLHADLQDDAFQETLDRYEALGDRRRLAVLGMLGELGELCACEIQAALGVTHATVSHHMGRLVDADLVQAEKRGRWVYYELADGAGRWVP